MQVSTSSENMKVLVTTAHMHTTHIYSASPNSIIRKKERSKAESMAYTMGIFQGTFNSVACFVHLEVTF